MSFKMCFIPEELCFIELESKIVAFFFSKSCLTSDYRGHPRRQAVW